MSGWFPFVHDDPNPSLLKRLYRAWMQLGQYVASELDHRPHSPVYLGQAVKKVISRRPGLKDKIRVEVYGNRVLQGIIDQVLRQFNLNEVVKVHGVVPHDEAIQRIQTADLLFMALPEHRDGSPDFRISSKTYEYLMTDRPILAALPPGENRKYLSDKPGVYLTPPRGIDSMADVIEHQVAAAFDGQPVRIDRSALHDRLTSTSRAQAFEAILNRHAAISDSSAALREKRDTLTSP